MKPHHRLAGSYKTLSGVADDPPPMPETALPVCSNLDLLCLKQEKSQYMKIVIHTREVEMIQES